MQLTRATLRPLAHREVAARGYAAAAPALLERLGNGDKTRVWPSVRRLLVENPGLDISTLSATGPKGTLTKGDVIAALSGGGSRAAAAPPAVKASSSTAPSAAAAVKPAAAAAPAKAPAQSPAPLSGFGDATFSEETPTSVRKARSPGIPSQTGILSPSAFPAASHSLLTPRARADHRLAPAREQARLAAPVHQQGHRPRRHPRPAQAARSLRSEGACRNRPAPHPPPLVTPAASDPDRVRAGSSSALVSSLPFHPSSARFL